MKERKEVDPEYHSNIFICFWIAESGSTICSTSWIRTKTTLVRYFEWLKGREMVLSRWQIQNHINIVVLYSTSLMIGTTKTQTARILQNDNPAEKKI